MATLTPERVSPDANSAEAPAPVQDSKLHTGPVARLLAKMSRCSNDYPHHQMDSGNWRNIAL